MAIYLDPPSDSPSAVVLLQPQEMDGLVLRNLCSEDYNAGFCELLGQLTTIGEIPFSFFERRMHEIEESKRQHMLVLEDRETGRIVATGTLLIEKKFIHEAGLLGHIEDVGLSYFHLLYGFVPGKTEISLAVIWEELTCTCSFSWQFDPCAGSKMICQLPADDDQAAVTNTGHTLEVSARLDLQGARPICWEKSFPADGGAGDSSLERPFLTHSILGDIHRYSGTKARREL